MRKEFTELLEAAITERLGDLAAAKLFKAELAAYFQGLPESFTPHRAGVSPARAFLIAHARAIEDFIAAFYRYVLRDSFGDFTPPNSVIPIAFAALGSFAREQCAPRSDIDLMIVFKQVEGYNLRPIIERVLRLAWDSGFALGHRAAEISELSDMASSDITIKTALLEARFIGGSRLLWIDAEGVLERLRLANARGFAALKAAESRERKAKNPIAMEPNLKESAGGLRDANTLFWIARAIYGISHEKDLIGNVFDENSYREFHIACDLLYRARIALHLLTNKHFDKLVFDRQRDVALMLGFTDYKTKRAERFLLQKILHSLRVIDRFSDYYIAKILEKFEDDFATENFTAIAKVLAQKPKPFLYDIKDVMRLNKSENQRQRSILKDIILAIFAREDSHIILECFDRAGKLDILLPPLKGIIFLAQFDGYHTRPADEHSILTLKNLNLLNGEKLELFRALSESDQRLLRLVAILHDCGKGSSRDHSEIGAKRFRKFAKFLQLKDEEIESGFTLIKYHTLISNIARKEDIHSDRVVFSFAMKLGSKRLISMLYLLTICDMSAVAPNVYTHFWEITLKDLYIRAIEALENSDLISEAASRSKKEKQLKSDQDFALLNDRLQSKIFTIDSTLFFLKYKANEIIEIAKMCEDTKIIKIKAQTEPILRVDIIAKKPFNLGWFLGKLSRFDLGSMDIFRIFDGAKLFRMFFRKPLDESIEFIEKLAIDGLDMSRTMKYNKPQIKRKEIDIDIDHSPTYARMTLNLPDQQGLMAFVIDIFDRNEIDIAAAKIATIKNKANNLLLIEKSGGFAQKTKVLIAELTQTNPQK
ncbi:MAG: HD domain-containing protein [Helicobacteraceae bacterium]|jgi:[protein-PII] uridylyltransferase|nr:HD domain-containing protein [Helicobacteraceae bacterium]